MPAVTHDATASAVGAAVTTVSVSLTVANNPNRYLLIACGASDTSAPGDLTSCTWNTSENATEIADQVMGANERSWLYELVAPTVTTANAAFTCATNCDGLFIGASCFYNVSQTVPRNTVRVNYTANTQATVWASCDGGLGGGLAYGYGMIALSTASAHTLAPVNGIPEFITAGALLANTGVTSRTPAAPAGAIYGDLELCHCSSENNATHSVSGSGWVKIGQTNSGASFTVSHYYRIYDGTNVDPTISWTGSADASARRYLFRDTKASGAPAVYHGTVGTGTGTTHTSTGANTTEADVLAVYIDICNANTGMVPEASWTERVDSGSASGPVRSYLADQEVPTAGTGTGNVSETGGNAAWVQQQFEVYNGDSGDPTELTERESWGGNFASCGVAYEDAKTFNTFGWTRSTGTTDQLCGIAVTINPTRTLPPATLSDSFLQQMLPNW